MGRIIQVDAEDITANNPEDLAKWGRETMERLALKNALRLAVAGHLYDAKEDESEPDRLLNAIKLLKEVADDYEKEIEE